MKMLSNAIIAIIKFYQKIISPLLSNSCRHYPTCSQYMINQIKDKGICIGIGKGIFRICSCNPFVESKIDID